ncbi:hypothetical protein A0U92_03505 [Acetobacter aceti]|uniref:HTH cro/C1-type domain-containing protein n=1 Tax=Acetobacter aceti TaxID=435 RepID=A0A1U9KE28_ACEAC|nr:helix-turn-helix transcriptional regulator [Acetobacter aceti]AQS83987.1 hypothetical protein A0U92_03505 [Acetobacter aceti]
MKSKESLGSRLKSLRQSRGMPQIDVAVAIGISRSHLAEIEGGKDPGFRTFCDLADFFSVSLDYLYRGSPTHRNNINEEDADTGESEIVTFWRTLSTDEKAALRMILMRDKVTGVA